MAPRCAPDPPARRALEKLVATARADPLFAVARDEIWSADARLAALEAYCALAYEKGRDRGRRDRLRQAGGR